MRILSILFSPVTKARRAIFRTVQLSFYVTLSLLLFPVTFSLTAIVFTFISGFLLVGTLSGAVILSFFIAQNGSALLLAAFGSMSTAWLLQALKRYIKDTDWESEESLYTRGGRLSGLDETIKVIPLSMEDLQEDEFNSTLSDRS
jgi:hypothetical protein